MITKLF